MNVQPDISLGAIINLAAIIFAAGSFYAMTKALSKNMDEMKLELKELNVLIKDVAVQKSRLDSQDKRLNQMYDEITLLRRGEGYIQRSRQAVDGEYP